MRVALSNLQYTMLRMFATENKEFRMAIPEAAQFRQDSFRSMLIRQYVVYDKKPNSRGKIGFRLTDEGREAYHKFDSSDILRHVASLKLTSYFVVPKLPVAVAALAKAKTA